MSRRYRAIFFILASIPVLLCMTPFLEAQNSEENGKSKGETGPQKVEKTVAQSAGSRLTLIDQLVSSAFIPKSTFLLSVDPQFGFRKLPASFLDQGSSERSASERKLLLGSAGAFPDTTNIPIYFTFFLKGDATTFAATPVRIWGTELARDGGQPVEQVVEEVSELRKRKEDLVVSLKELDQSLRSLRKQASQIAGVDEIVDLKLELSRVQGYGDTSGAEQARLQHLIEIGRTRKDPPEINQRRHELTLQLQDTAEKTALVLRLQARRKEVARQTLERKLALVKQMSRYDPTSIAQDIVRIRKQNAELQQRVGVPSPADSSDQF